VIPLTLQQIAEAVGGQVQHADPQAVVDLVVTDSRAVTGGCLFVAIEGERVDGHSFAAQVCADGAVAVLSRRALPEPCIVVPDPVRALGKLATWYRRSLLHCQVIGITGSSGKTTTKDLVSSVLEGRGPTVSARGSYNTEVGMPLTILEADPDTQFLVLEMGMRGRGHIADLVTIAEPDIGVVVNVGTAHLELLGSVEAIAQAKGELVRDLPETATAVLNGDDPHVRVMATKARHLFFGEGSINNVRALDVTIDDRARAHFTLAIGDDRAQVDLQFHGEHYVSNALAAAAVGHAVGMTVQAIADALSAATPRSPWRMAIHEGGAVTVVNDAYNANPESVRAALKALTAMKGSGRAWAILGEMRELGDASVVEHDAIGRLAVRLDIDRLVCVGEATRVMHLGASTEGSWGEESVWVPDADAAIAHVTEHLVPGDVVLVKASRSVGLERVADVLIERTAQP